MPFFDDLPPVTALLLALALPASAAEPLPASHAPQSPAAWREPVAPFAVAERTRCIGTAGLTALLVRTDEGVVLVDGGLPQAADMLLGHLRALGVKPQDVRWILHSHAHFDHAGALAALKRATGARAASNAESALLLARGGNDDLHFGDDMPYPPVTVDRYLLDGETPELGGVRFTAQFTPGHTPGSLSWTWNDRRDGKPVGIAYVDSLTAPDYRLIGHPRYPRIVDDYRRTFATVRALPCDLLITPHPEASGWQTRTPAASKPVSCEAYADAAAERFERQLMQQRRAR